jgi:carbon-monoxide dehydrogenase large subunit
MLGQPIKRREDPRLITGAGTYVDDITLPGMLYLALVRSPHGHARVRRIDTEAARNAPGVVAVITARDLEPLLKEKYPVEAYEGPGDRPEDQIFDEQAQGIPVPGVEPLARRKVRYIGEPVAAVAADTIDAAQAALAAIELEVEPAPAVTEIEAAIADVISTAGAKAPSDMGKVMGALKGRLAGKADMTRVSALVKAKLAG